MKAQNNKSLPIIPLRNLVLIPESTISFAVVCEKTLKSIEDSLTKDKLVFLSMQIDPNIKEPSVSELHTTGTIGFVKKLVKNPDYTHYAVVEGLSRGEIKSTNDDETIANVVECSCFDKKSETDDEIVAISQLLKDEFYKICEYMPIYDQHLKIKNIDDAKGISEMVDIVISRIIFDENKKQQFLEIHNQYERLKEVFSFVKKEISMMKFKKSISDKMELEFEKKERNEYLKDKLKIIKNELHGEDNVFDDIELYEKKLKSKKISKDKKKIFKKEIAKLKRVSDMSPESNILKNYIECVLDLPWGKLKKSDFNLENSERILNEDHYGLHEIKEHILEFLAVKENAPNVTTPILCLVGPPGVGKTSFAKSIARAMNRQYDRISLGGLKDLAEIKGHRRTYVGAMPGNIISSIKHAKTNNMLIVLDEIDKISSSYMGDPSATLLEVLDPEQNETFLDFYLHVPYDLSEVFFVCTANDITKIPAPLKDRMEIITLTSYTFEEKINIATKYLYEKQLLKHGLKKKECKISEKAFSMIINNYTKEAGVRELERKISTVCRKCVKMLLEGKAKTFTISERNLEKYLGIKKYNDSKIFNKPQIGAVQGLAWTSVGGETLAIEVNTMKGTGEQSFTGNIGKIMNESSKAAMSFIRSNHEKFGIADDFYKNTDIDIHIPEGAIFKDGPSAGITITTAIISALSNTYINNSVAMTGEVTIRGRVLPVGAIKEKVVAAKISGITKIILPAENAKDLDKIPDEIKEGLEFVLVEHMFEVLKVAFLEGDIKDES